MADAPVKAPAQISPIDWDVTEFVRNPGGAILDIQKSHPGAVLAAHHKEGWRFATLDEARAYCELHNLDAKGLEGYEKHVRDAQKAAERADAEASGVPVAPAEAEVAAEEPKAKAK